MMALIGIALSTAAKYLSLHPLEKIREQMKQLK
jgi:hypothetical protein